MGAKSFRPRHTEEPTVKPKSHVLWLEQLEIRRLLTAYNPGDPALIADGDQYYFIQGEDSDHPSDARGEAKAEWILVASYDGPGYAQLYDSAGNDSLDFGTKIGDILIAGATEDSSLRIQGARFQEDWDLTKIGAVDLLDQPDAQAEALDLAVPEGQSGDTATYNTGRLIVAGSGEDTDWYTFDAQEGEKIRVTSSEPSVGMW